MIHLSECILCRGNDIELSDRENHFCRCRTCGLVFDNPRPDPKEVIAYYSKPTKYDPWLKQEKARDLLWKRRLKKLRIIRQGGSLLDVGTGIGQFLFQAKAVYDETLGTEVSESAMRIAREKYGLDLIAGEIETLETDKRFDLITMFHVLEHVYFPRAVIEKCRALLKDDGYLVIAVPNDVFCWKTRLRALFQRFGLGKFKSLSRLGLPKLSLDGSQSEIHVSHFTPVVLAQTLNKAGFCVTENSLDPFFASRGFLLLVDKAIYHLHALLLLFTGRNLYDTIWLAAQKVTESDAVDPNRQK